MKKKKAPAPRRSWLSRVVRRLVKAALFAVLLAAALSTLFIGIRCFSRTGQPQTPSAEVRRVSAGLDGYTREEASTFLTLPEWYIVYNTEEYATFLGNRGASRFPHIGSIRQFWRYYGEMCDATRGVYPFSGGNHLMLAVIGSSFTIEYVIKGVYENTFGRVTEWTSGRDTPEDAFAHKTALEYGAFMHTVPWYEFPFFSKVGQLWRDIPKQGPHMVRKWERRLALTAEYGVKGAYGWLIGLSSGAAYGAESLRIHAWIDQAQDVVFADGVVKKVKQVGPQSYIVTIPRYEAFTVRTKLLVSQGVRFLDIAGNDEILITILAPAAVETDNRVTILFEEPFLTQEALRRIGLKVPVPSLHEVLTRLEKGGATIEHIYDY